MGSTVLYAALGIALGTLTGIALAASPWFSNTQASAPSLGQVTAKAAESNAAPVVAVSQIPIPELPARSQAGELLASTAKTAAVTTAAEHPVPARKKSSARRMASFSLRPHLFRRKHTLAKTSLSPAVEQVAYAVERYAFIIEGDVTVVDYDTSEGTIATHEGKTFVIGRTAAESAVISWQDYHANVHYRCDQSGSCTLMRAGVVIPNARLSL
jgi:hypothetical protein